MLEELFLILAVAISGLILLIHLILTVSVLLNRLRDVSRARRPPAALSAAVSVVVVAKDEESSLPRLLAALEAQTFRDFEIVLLNDRSRDRTVQIMKAFRKKHGSRVRLLENDEEPVGMGPKQFALDLAVRAAAGEVLLFTDADCLVPTTWVERLLPYFADPRVGIVFGQVSLESSRRFLSRFQAFDQPLIHQWNSGTAGVGMPGSCFGNNLAARKAMIDQIGGFKALGYTLTEDAALTTAAGRHKWRVCVCTRTDAMIRTYPRPSWAEFLNQHLRWNSGAFYHEDLPTRLGYRFITLFLIASLVVIPFAFHWPFLFVSTASSFISVGLMALLAGLLYRQDKTAYLLRLVPYTCFFLLFYSVVTLLAMLRLSFRWKGESWEAVRGGKR
jgi:1,2-diacylglycerol 3-beta-glucosyltransferase